VPPSPDMRRFEPWSLPLGLIYLARQITGQEQPVNGAITVLVGDDGAFYQPNNFSAPAGTIVNFQFVGTAHAVVQASNSTPCQRLPGGFDSGLAGLKTGGSLSQPIEWNLTVTDDTTPIWFYCKAQQPTPHCQARMVGVINPPNQEAFMEYINASANAPVTQQPSNFSLHGIGATATAPPIGTSKLNAAPIIGGVVGGVGAVAIMVVLGLLLFHQRRKARRFEEERLAIDGSSWLTSPSAGQGWTHKT